MGVAADLIMSRRVGLKLTKREVAQRVGIDPAMVTRLENGSRRVPKIAIVVFAKTLSLSEDEIVEALVQDYASELRRLVRFQKMSA